LLCDWLFILIKNEGLKQEVSDCEKNHVLLKKGLAPAEVSIPSVPSDWTPQTAKLAKGKPTFKSVNNPGEWPKFTCQPKFLETGTKHYAHHSLPTGARLVPVNQQGQRVVDGWEFHREKWNSDQASSSNNKSRSGATSTNPFPDDRKG
jgi:hypothetical protein